MVEWLLIAVLYTPRAASHVHDLEVTRYPTQEICEVAVARLGHGAICVPVAPLPKNTTTIKKQDRLPLPYPQGGAK